LKNLPNLGQVYARRSGHLDNEAGQSTPKFGEEKNEGKSYDSPRTAIYNKASVNL